MATVGVHVVALRLVGGLEDASSCVNSGNCRSPSEFRLRTSWGTPALTFPSHRSRCQRRNRRHGSNATRSFFNQFTVVGDGEIGGRLGQFVEKTGLAAQTVLDSTQTLLKRLGADVEKISLPAEAAANIIKSLDRVQYALREVAIDPTTASTVIKQSIDQVQTIVQELEATTSSTVGTLARRVETAAEGLGSGSGHDLAEEIGRLGKANGVVLEKLESVWQTIARSGSRLTGTDTGLQFLERTSGAFQPGADNVGGAIKSQFEASASLQQLVHSLSDVLHQSQLLTDEVGLQASNLVNGIAHVDTSSFQASAHHLTTFTGNMMGEVATVVGGPYFATSSSAAAVVVATAGSVVVVVSSAFLVRSKGFIEGEDLPLRYNAQAIAAYFRRRPWEVISRAVKIAFQCSALAASIVVDFSSGKGKENEKLRASQLVDLIARLGPTAIKVFFEHQPFLLFWPSQAIASALRLQLMIILSVNFHLRVRFLFLDWASVEY